MNKVLVLGAGRQGKAAIYDLEQSSAVDRIIAADNKADKRRRVFEKEPHFKKTEVVHVDASVEENTARLLEQYRPEVVICMLPPHMAPPVARSAMEREIHFVGVSEASEISDLHEEAVKRKVSLLPEMGMDPGIDLILGRLALDELDTVWGLHSYAGGIPDARACLDNPIGYKISWTFEGVLESYTRPASLLREGREIRIEGKNIFDPEHVHAIEIPELGVLEAFPNGDALHYAKMYGMDGGSKDVGRFTLRWPGHCDFWRTMSTLGFLEDKPVEIQGKEISPVEFLVNHLGPRLQFRKNERDVAILKAQAWGFRSGKPIKAAYSMVDTRDVSTGFFAMNRTAGFAASIGAQMILSGEIRSKGVLSPVRDVPPNKFLFELEKRNINVDRRITEE